MKSEKGQEWRTPKLFEIENGLDDPLDPGTDLGEIVEPFRPSDIKISPQHPTIYNVLERLKAGEIILDPEFQRKGDIWSDEAQSRLIESILLRLPLPSFYFDATKQDAWEVVDGLQRLTALKKFVLEGSLSLTGFSILKEYNGKGIRFRDLPENLRRRILEFQLFAYTIEPGTPALAKYSIFQRINTGGLSLTPMEIRHALNRGEASRFLKEFTESKSFRNRLRLPSDRMEDRELVLRAVAFVLSCYQTYSKPLSSFLDKAMEKLGKRTKEENDALGESIILAIDLQVELFGQHIFSHSMGKRRAYKLNSALFEVWVSICCRLSNTEIECLRKSRTFLRAEYEQLLKDHLDFHAATTYTTSSIESVKIRFSEIGKLIDRYISC